MKISKIAAMVMACVGASALLTACDDAASSASTQQQPSAALSAAPNADADTSDNDGVTGMRNSAPPSTAVNAWSNVGLDPPEDIGGSKPPLFKPTMPTFWNWNQMQDATKALNVLFDKCPKLSSWMPDMWKVSMYVDKSLPQFADVDRQMFGPMGWTNPIVVSIITIPKPHDPIFGGDANAVVFYLGTGKRTGILMQGGFFPLQACGGKPTYTFRTELDRSSDKTGDPDVFIAAPELEFLSKLQAHGNAPI